MPTQFKDSRAFVEFNDINEYSFYEGFYKAAEQGAFSEFHEQHTSIEIFELI